MSDPSDLLGVMVPFAIGVGLALLITVFVDWYNK